MPHVRNPRPETAQRFPAFPVLNPDDHYSDGFLDETVAVTLDRAAWLTIARGVRAAARRRIAVADPESPYFATELVRIGRLYEAWVAVCVQADIAPVGGVFDA